MRSMIGGAAAPPAFGLLLGLLVLGACSGPPATWYHLEAGPAPTTVVADPVATVAMEEVRLPPYLDRSDIVMRRPGNRLAVSETAQWAEPLGAAIARVVRSDLAAALGPRGVRVVPADFADSTLDIYIAVSRFEVTADGTAVLHAQWRLVDGESGEEILLREADHRQPAAGEGHPYAVAALNRTVHEMAAAIADAVAAVVGGDGGA